MSNYQQSQIEAMLLALEQLGATAVDIAVGFYRRVPAHPADSPFGWERPRKPEGADDSHPDAGYFQQRLGVSFAGARAQAARLRFANQGRRSDDDKEQGGCIYIRAARDRGNHPVLLLDDLSKATAFGIAKEYLALVVETSPANYQVVLRCDRSASEEERLVAQRWLAAKVGADPASVSGEHWHRWGGFVNRKPWRLVDATELPWVKPAMMPRLDGKLVPLDHILSLATARPMPASEPAGTAVSLAHTPPVPSRAHVLPDVASTVGTKRKQRGHGIKRDAEGVDISPSGKELGYALYLLYFRHFTVERAINEIASQASTREHRCSDTLRHVRRTVKLADAEIKAGNYPNKYPHRRRCRRA